MCTLTYVTGQQGRIITINRDENSKRNARVLSPFETPDSKKYFIAKEPVHGGTNVAVLESKAPQVNVLLNGAFEPHAFGKTYRLSRGIMVLESLEFKNLKSFSEEYNFNQIEPFTLVRFDKAIEELRWDASRVHYRQFDPDTPVIWSSAQLYSPQSRAKREAWFDAWLKTHEISAQSLGEFHHKAGEGKPESDLIMHIGNQVETVSITQVADAQDHAGVTHWNIVDGAKNEYAFK